MRADMIVQAQGRRCGADRFCCCKHRPREAACATYRTADISTFLHSLSMKKKPVSLCDLQKAAGQRTKCTATVRCIVRLSVKKEPVLCRLTEKTLWAWNRKLGSLTATCGYGFPSSRTCLWTWVTPGQTRSSFYHLCPFNSNFCHQNYSLVF